MDNGTTAIIRDTVYMQLDHSNVYESDEFSRITEATSYAAKVLLKAIKSDDDIDFFESLSEYSDIASGMESLFYKFGFFDGIKYILTNKSSMSDDLLNSFLNTDPSNI